MDEVAEEADSSAGVDLPPLSAPNARQESILARRRLAMALEEAARQEHAIDVGPDAHEREDDEGLVPFARPVIAATCCLGAVGLVAVGSVCVELGEACGPAK